MQPALGDTVLTLDELHTYMEERVRDITIAIDSGRLNGMYADVASVRRGIYRNLIEIIDRGYIHETGSTEVTPDAGKRPLVPALVRKLRSFRPYRQSAT